MPSCKTHFDSERRGTSGRIGSCLPQYEDGRRLRPVAAEPRPGILDIREGPAIGRPAVQIHRALATFERDNVGVGDMPGRGTPRDRHGIKFHLAAHLNGAVVGREDMAEPSMTMVLSRAIWPGRSCLCSEQTGEARASSMRREIRRKVHGVRPATGTGGGSIRCYVRAEEQHELSRPARFIPVGSIPRSLRHRGPKQATKTRRGTPYEPSFSRPVRLSLCSAETCPARRPGRQRWTQPNR